MSAMEMQPGEKLKLTVRFGSSEREDVLYVRPAEGLRFHFVRRVNGELARIHDTQVETSAGAFSGWAAQNKFPNGRWT